MDYKDLKREICKRLKKKIKPFLWKSSFLDDCKYLCVFDEPRKVSLFVNVEEIEGFYTNGVITDHHMAIVVEPFSSFPLEDLISLESLVDRVVANPKRYFPKKRMELMLNFPQ